MRRVALVVCFATAAVSTQSHGQNARPYDPSLADQFQSAQLGDTIPSDPAIREIWARNLAFDATIYGQPAVLTYRQIYDQAIDKASPHFVGFNRFRHERHLAKPGFLPFKTPNADTLYSNAYLDLRDGPVLLDVPDTNGRYFTANFLDPFGNATNISARTHGTHGGHFLIATTDWQGPVPGGRQVFRVTSPIMWILLRVLVQDERDEPVANALQDRFVISARTALDSPHTPYPDAHDTSPAGFMKALDFVLRESGFPSAEKGYVARFDGIGLGGARKLADALGDPAVQRGVEAGFTDAQRVITSAIVQNGSRVGSWSEPRDLGRYGFNYLYRAAINTLGTGANVIDENYPFSTFQDAEGKPLSGKTGPYELVFAPPPPARYFWSATVYDAATRELFANAAGKYAVGDRTPGLRAGADGSVTLRFANIQNAKHVPVNTLPVPNGPFYVVVRAQGPGPDMISRRWTPPPIRKVVP